MKDKSVHRAGKRKRAVARATVKAGNGKITINRIPLKILEPVLIREKIREALMFAPEIINKINISIITSGGGIMSQAESARLAIARVLVQYSKNKNLERDYLDYDRHFLVADIRRKEMRKPNTCGKARAKRQKSYR